MTRDKFIEKWGARMGQFYTDKELSDDLDSLLIWANGMLAYKSLPPAEGAETEETKEMAAIFNLEQKLDIPMKDRFHNSAKGKALFDAIYGKQQPTAEGAEEYIKRKHPQDWDEIPQWHIDELNEFATLHAQRIADKMVSERLRDELIKFKLHGGDFCEDYAIERVDEYLKSREKCTG